MSLSRVPAFVFSLSVALRLRDGVHTAAEGAVFSDASGIVLTLERRSVFHGVLVGVSSSVLEALSAAVFFGGGRGHVIPLASNN